MKKMIASLMVLLAFSAACTSEVDEETEVPVVQPTQTIAPAHGLGVKSGVVCPYGKQYLCFATYCGCY